MRHHLLIFTILAAACVVLATGASATDYIKGYHKLQLWGTEEAKTFAAKIDGQVFHTLRLPG